MIKIGITGSISSGKTTASKIYLVEEALYLVQMMKLKNYMLPRVFNDY